VLFAEMIVEIDMKDFIFFGWRENRDLESYSNPGRTEAQLSRVSLR